MTSQTQVEDMFAAALANFMSGGFVDLHTHLLPPCCGDDLCKLGPNDTFDYHYLYGEVLSSLNLTDQQLARVWAMPQEERVRWLIGQSYGDGALPLSEGRLGPITAARALGLETSSGNMLKILGEWRTMFADTGRYAYMNHVFQTSGVSKVVCTNSIFSAEELAIYLNDDTMAEWDPRFRFALRLDEAIHKRDTAEFIEACEKMGFGAAAGALSLSDVQQASREMVEYWLDRFEGAAYAAVSLSGETDFSDPASTAMLFLEKVMIPVCKERGVPVTLMPFVRRQIRPGHRNAGDVVQRGDVNGLIDFMAKHPDVLFLVTPLHEGDNYDLSFATRALGHVRGWGHWWCNLNPSLVEQQLRFRLENNGYAHFGVNSDARILDQLLFKFTHYWRILKKVVVDKYMSEIAMTEWPITTEQIEATIRQLQDVDALLGLAKPRDISFEAPEIPE